jgi:hypothetical protein
MEPLLVNYQCILNNKLEYRVDKTCSIVLSSVAADFVCPHLRGKAGENPHSPWQAADGEHPQAEKFNGIWNGYTVGGPNVGGGPDYNVPDQATNWGSPPNPNGVPGDPLYTAIWDSSG